MKLILFVVFLCFSVVAQAQSGATASQPLTMEEYKKAKTFSVKDLDKDTYVKFENTFVLDRYEMRPPYFVTGDDGLKKRIDLYTLLRKGDTDPLGTLIYYTTEEGKRYTALQPGIAADDNIWAQYFEDIHAIDRQEKNFVLKLSYVLSKELSFQLHKAINSGKAAVREGNTYGTNICFPGNQWVTMADGTRKQLSAINKGDRIVTMDENNKTATAEVARVVMHDEETYAVTELLLLQALEKTTAAGTEVRLHTKTLSATPNHPIASAGGRKTVGEIGIGERLLCYDEHTNLSTTYTVWNTTHKSSSKQKVYNVELAGTNQLLINNVVVLQK